MYKKIIFILCGLMLIVSQSHSMEPEGEQPIRRILNGIREYYTHEGVDFNEVFFPLKHPQWTQDRLLCEVGVTPHIWYFKARLQSFPEVERGNLEEWREQNKSIKRKFILFYSAACLGHQLAAIEAGKMLLNPQYNDVIPAIVKFTDLPEEVERLDLRRLNQNETDNKQLLNIMDQLEHGAGQQKGLEDVCKIDQTPEVIAFRLLFEDLKDYASEVTRGTHIPNQKPRLEKITSFIEGAQLNSPFIDRLLLHVESASSSATFSSRISNFKKFLNYNFFMDYIWSLKPQTECVQHTSPVDFMSKNAKAIYKLKQLIEIQRVAVLLGHPSPKCFFSMENAFDPSKNFVLWNAAHKQCDLSDNPIHVFLIYLTLTRRPNCQQFENIKSLLYGYLANHGYPVAAKNSERFKRIEDYFYSQPDIIMG